MGELAVVNFVSVDGVMQSVLSPEEDRDGGFDRGGWVLPYVDAMVEKFMSDSTAGAGALLLGRRTYEIFASTWPYADRSDPAVAAMNAMPKYVASRTLTNLEWENSTVLGDDLPAEVSELKDRTDGELVLLGSGVLLRTLVERDLIDEYRLLLFPLILGGGKKLFAEGTPPRNLTLTASTASTTGVLINTYRRTDR